MGLEPTMKKLLSTAGIIGGLAALIVLLNVFGNIYSSEKNLRSDVKQLKQEMLYVRSDLEFIRDILAKEKVITSDIRKRQERRIREFAYFSDSPSILATYFSSPKRVFFINRAGRKREYLPFEGSSSNGIWSPDLKQILFQGRESPEKPVNIFIYEVLTKSIKKLTEDIGDNIDPVWSHDGAGIYFCSNRYRGITKRYDLFYMDAEGDNEKRILKYDDIDPENQHMSICLPSVCPDGKCISFSTESKTGWDLWIMLSINHKIRIRISGWGYCRMKWNSINSDEVVYVKDRREEDTTRKTDTDIIVANLFIDEENERIELRNPQNLTKFSFEDEYPYCPSDNFPDWSFDGERILFSSVKSKKPIQENRKWYLYVINKDGNERKKLGDKKIKAIYPDW